MFQISKKRLNWLDISKGIAILMMIVGHVYIIPWQPFRKIIFSIHMPLFFVAAGFVLGIHNGKINLKQSAKRLLVPYLITAVLTFLISWIKNGNISLINELERILWASGVAADYGPGLPITGQTSIPIIGALWFLPCMFFAKLFFQLILHGLKKMPEIVRAVAVVCLSALGYIIGQHYKIPLNLDIALFSMVFFYAGYLMQNLKAIEIKRNSVGIICMFFWFLALKLNGIEMSARFYRDFPLCLFVIAGAIGGCFAVFVISDEILQKIPVLNKFLIYCGQNSLIILCVHHLESLLIPWNNFLMNTSLGNRNLVRGAIIALIRIIIAIVITEFYILLKKAIASFIKKEKTV